MTEKFLFFPVATKLFVFYNMSTVKKVCELTKTLFYNDKTVRDDELPIFETSFFFH